MLIGVPKEIKDNEYRVGEALRLITSHVGGRVRTLSRQRTRDVNRSVGAVGYPVAAMAKALDQNSLNHASLEEDSSRDRLRLSARAHVKADHGRRRITLGYFPVCDLAARRSHAGTLIPRA